MAKVWNKKDLEPPPVCLLKNFNDPDNTCLHEKTKDALTTCSQVLGQEKALSSEIYLLHRLLYKLRCQQRSLKSFRILKQIQTCLNNYQHMTLADHVGSVKSIYEEIDFCDINVYLPSQQMMEFVLTRLYGALVLLQKTADYCCTAYELLQQQLMSGMLIPQHMVFISLVSRVWTVSQSLKLHIKSCYNDIYPSIVKLEATAVK